MIIVSVKEPVETIHAFLLKLVFLVDVPESFDGIGFEIPKGLIEVKKYMPVGFPFHKSMQLKVRTKVEVWTENIFKKNIF